MMFRYSSRFNFDVACNMEFHRCSNSNFQPKASKGFCPKRDHKVSLCFCSLGSPWTSSIVKSSLKALVSQINRSSIDQLIKEWNWPRCVIGWNSGPNGLAGCLKFHCERQHLPCTVWLQVKHTFPFVFEKYCELDHEQCFRCCFAESPWRIPTQSIIMRNTMRIIMRTNQNNVLQNHPDGFLLNRLLWHFLPWSHHEGAFWWCCRWSPILHILTTVFKTHFLCS